MALKVRQNKSWNFNSEQTPQTNNLDKHLEQTTNKNNQNLDTQNSIEKNNLEFNLNLESNKTPTPTNAYEASVMGRATAKEKEAKRVFVIESKRQEQKKKAQWLLPIRTFNKLKLLKRGTNKFAWEIIVELVDKAMPDYLYKKLVNEGKLDEENKVGGDK